MDRQVHLPRSLEILALLTSKISCRNGIHGNPGIFCLLFGIVCFFFAGFYVCEIPGFWGCCFGKGLYKIYPNKCSIFWWWGKSSERTCSPWFCGGLQRALFHLGVSQSHFSSQIIILINILTCSKTSPQKLVFAFHSGFYLRVLSVNSVNSVPDVSQSNGKIKSDTGRR